MNPVETVLLENIDVPNSCFVFPTDIAASRWADHLLRLRGGTVAMNKFIAWDIFKQNSIKSKVQNKKSIPSALRKIIVSRIVRENAEAVEQGKTPVFTSLIRPQWAEQAAQFAPWLTGLLPQLGVWFNKITGLSIGSILSADADKACFKFEGDDRDMFALARRYAQFLEAHGLFEPAWETPPFNDEGMECFIFFPESLSDYGEYRELLAASRHVKTISASDTGNLPCDTFFYTNSRTEITEAALYIRALHENSCLSWDSIAVCIPDAENYEPYVLREFTNRNIPFVKRSSKPLAHYPAGLFFRSVIDCTSQDFSFSALTSLILNRNLPWKDTAQIHNLVEFGINNNCISSWIEKEDGKEQMVNVWEDAFNQPFERIEPAARQFFRHLKQRLRSLRAAASFSEVRRQYFIFREHFFDMEKCSHETDLILSRCVSELMYLTEIEKDFPDVPAVDPFLFFTEYLGEVNYLAQQETSGVNILPYRTAASAPFDCHIVLGAGQDSLSVVFTRLDFLPRKKREELGIFDEDASSAFIGLHKFNSMKNAAFFCSEQTFSGFTIAHSKIGAPSKPQENYASDPALREKFCQDYYKAESLFNSSLSIADNSMPVKLHENQKDGFEKWKSRRKHKGSAGGKWNTGKTLLDLIRKKYAYNPEFSGKYGVSSSSLASFYQCSLKWIFERVLVLENVQIEASLMAENISGMVYHAALNLFFSELKKKNEKLLKPDYADRGPSLPGVYRKLLKHSVDKIFDSFPALESEGEPSDKRPQMSSLTARLLRAGKKHFQFNLENCLANFLSLFAGCRVTGCEKSYQAQRDIFFLNGKLDCILEAPPEKSPASSGEKPITEKKYIIVDFKMKSAPERGNCTGEGENGLSDFQLPMYITLAEENEKIEVHTALFYSILNFIPEVIIGTVQDVNTEFIIPKKEDERILYKSEMYNQIFMEFDQKARQFANEIATGNFTVFKTKNSECYSCKYNRICRTVYAINRENLIILGNINDQRN